MRVALALLLVAGLASAAQPDRWLAWDKAAHLTISTVTPVALNAGLRACHVSKPAAFWTALGLTAAACVGKELIDGKASWRDLTVDAVGLALAGIPGGPAGMMTGASFGSAAGKILGGATTGTAGATSSTNALATACGTAFLTTSGMLGMVVIRGMVVTGANAGDLTIRHLKVTSGTSTVKIGSMLKVRKVA